jgi:hypothetical protein
VTPKQKPAAVCTRPLTQLILPDDLIWSRMALTDIALICLDFKCCDLTRRADKNMTGPEGLILQR